MSAVSPSSTGIAEVLANVHVMRTRLADIIIDSGNRGMDAMVTRYADFDEVFAECEIALRGVAQEAGDCVCQDQHRRGYCTEPGCQYAHPTQGGDKGEAVGWTAYCPTTGGRLFARSESFAREQGQSIYAEHGFTVDPVYTAAPQPASNAAAGKTWTPVDFWKFVSGLAGEFEADQMRDMLAQRGLRIVGISDPAYAAKEPDGYNGCYRAAIEALNYLASHTRPAGGQERFNAEHLLQIADEMKRSRASSLPSTTLGNAADYCHAHQGPVRLEGGKCPLCSTESK